MNQSKSLALVAMTVAAGASATAFTAVVVVGVVRSWHALPYWDMWNGYLGFWYQVADGDLTGWWAQHNEHRIVLARILFWIDLAVFGGRGPFLIVGILLALAVTTVILVSALRWRLADEHIMGLSRMGPWLMSFTIISISMAWMQSENLIWGFQGPFMLAVLLGLAAFMSLAQSARRLGPEPAQARWWAVLGCSCAALAPWTIASGLIVPFIAAGLAWLLRLHRLYVAVLAAVAVISVVAYRVGYVSPSLHASPLESLLDSPRGIAHYLAVYLGGPVWHATDSRWLAVLAGAALLCAAAAATWRAVRATRRPPTGLAALAFIWFVVFWGLGTAAGRINFGVEQALSGRYQTPVLTAWACLLIVAAPRIQRSIAQGSLSMPTALVAVSLVLLPQQVSALTSDPTPQLYSRDAATLALALGVPDSEVIGAVFPVPEPAIDLSRRAISDGLTILSGPPYASLIPTLGSSSSASSSIPCAGWIDSVTAIEGSNLSKVTGWLVTGVPVEERVLSLVDDETLIRGYVNHGGPRSDVQAAVANAGPNSGFIGYMTNGLAEQEIYLKGADWQCSTPLGNSPKL